MEGCWRVLRKGLLLCLTEKERIQPCSHLRGKQPGPRKLQGEPVVLGEVGRGRPVLFGGPYKRNPGNQAGWDHLKVRV